MSDKPAVFTKTKKLVDKANQVRQRFADSLEKAKEDAETLQEEVTKLQAQEKDIYSLFVMDEIDSSAYEEAKADTQAKRNQLTNIQNKINDIDELEKHELAKVYAEYGKIQKEFNQASNQAHAETKQKLIEAKQEFLQKIIDLSNEQFDYYIVERQITDIGVDAGKERGNYMSYPNPYFDGFGLEVGTGSDFINIGNRELHGVYGKRTIRPNI